METLDKQELEEVLVDVRKAYRLLYFYQRRVMDTVQFIGDTVSKNLASGYSLFSSMAPRNGSKINLDCWAWDWLPMYCYEYYFGKEEIDNAVYEFAIAIYSDSGYDDSTSNHDQTEVEFFLPVEESKTRLFFYLGRNMWKPKDFEYEWSSNSNDEIEYGNEEKKFISKRFDLSDFRDEESIVANINLFKKYCERKGLDQYFKR